MWVASSPIISACPRSRTDVRGEYLEIAVITALLRSAAKSTRLTELIHHAIPYPVTACS